MSDRSEHTMDLDKESMCLTAKDKPQPISMVWYVGNNFQILNSQDVQKYPFKIKKKKQTTESSTFHRGEGDSISGVQGIVYSIPGKATPQTAIIAWVQNKKAGPCCSGSISVAKAE